MNAFIRWTTVVAVVAIAAVAAWVSYEHALAVVRAYGETGAVGYAYPATIDGMVYGSSMAMLDSARRGLRTPSLARWMLGGIAATLAANVLNGIDHGLLGSVIAAWPALAPVGSYELLMAMIRREAVPQEGARESEAVAAEIPIPIEMTLETVSEAVSPDAGPETEAVPEPVPGVLPAAVGSATVPAPRNAPRTRRATASKSARKTAPQKRAEVTPEDAEAAFSDLLARGEVPSIRAVQGLGLGFTKAKALAAHLETVAAARGASEELVTA